jgi:(p)ppGpp synthase/HD superfamily hydrolase
MKATIMSYAKRRIALRYWLQGAEYFRALKAMYFVEKLYEGNFRKDGVTPEFDHVVSIASVVRTLPGLLYREDTIIAALGHDVGEKPYSLPRSEYEPIFGSRAAEAVELMTKEVKGIHKDEALLDAAMANNPIASIVKPVDRNHNLETMSGVFSLAKQGTYVAEAERRFLPMVKIGRRLFPEQEPAYENIRLNMVNQSRLVRCVLEARKAA